MISDMTSRDWHKTLLLPATIRVVFAGGVPSVLAVQTACNTPYAVGCGRRGDTARLQR